MEHRVPRTIQFHIEEDPLAVLRKCGGFYECPKAPDGTRLGPLVGYAGTYDPEKTKHFVGDAYANLAKAEMYPNVFDWYARQLLFKIPDQLLHPIDVFCGAPMGGLALAQDLSRLSYRRYAYAEKKVLKPTEGGQREKSTLVWGRHEIFPGDSVAIVEDVTNNFSTTDDMIALIELAGGKVKAIVSLLNRSLTVENAYQTNGGWVPVISLVRKAIPEYRQTDEEVAADIASGNIIWKPKLHWNVLEEAMAKSA